MVFKDTFDEMEDELFHTTIHDEVTALFPDDTMRQPIAYAMWMEYAEKTFHRVAIGKVDRQGQYKQRHVFWARLKEQQYEGDAELKDYCRQQAKKSFAYSLECQEKARVARDLCTEWNVRESGINEFH